MFNLEAYVKRSALFNQPLTSSNVYPDFDRLEDLITTQYPIERTMRDIDYRLQSAIAEAKKKLGYQSFKFIGSEFSEYELYITFKMLIAAQDNPSLFMYILVNAYGFAFDFGTGYLYFDYKQEQDGTYYYKRG